MDDDIDWMLPPQDGADAEQVISPPTPPEVVPLGSFDPYQYIHAIIAAEGAPRRFWTEREIAKLFPYTRLLGIDPVAQTVFDEGKGVWIYCKKGARNE